MGVCRKQSAELPGDERHGVLELQAFIQVPLDIYTYTHTRAPFSHPSCSLLLSVAFSCVATQQRGEGKETKKRKNEKNENPRFLHRFVLLCLYSGRDCEGIEMTHLVVECPGGIHDEIDSLQQEHIKQGPKACARIV
jgi:hypothetical protein